MADPTATLATPERPERPIQSRDEDKLERSAFVRRVTDALINRKSGKATGVVVGITGPWGSGKSSILNLVNEQITSEYKEAVVLRFDPWLISGRNDVITQFIGELIRKLQSDSKLANRFHDVVKILGTYGEHLAPVASLAMPILGPALRSAAQLIREALKSKETLYALRGRLTQELQKLSVPIVVLIDEVDRIEDEEIRAVAQLVRSVADFPGMSYVLAYDPKRVIQALGAGVEDKDRGDRGRAYLEKIVQLQIPLPVTFEEEIVRMLSAELIKLQQDLQLPDNFKNIERYQQLANMLAAHLVGTPRDIARLIGTFHVLAGMLRSEVDWIDVLAYSALLVKAPHIVDVMRSRPDEFSDDILSEAAMIRRAARKKISAADRMSQLVPETEDRTGTSRVLEFLFPALAEGHSRRDVERADALHRRRPLLTTLRLGLVPGAYSRAEIEALARKAPQQIAEVLRGAYTNDTLAQLIDRVEHLYLELPEFD